MASAQPLQAYPAFSCAHVDELAALVETTLGATIERAKPDKPQIAARANRFVLPNSGLWFCSYGMPLSLRFPENDIIRIQFHHQGAGGSRTRGQIVPVSETRACVSSSAISFDFGHDFEQVVWRIPKATLVRKLATLTGGPVSGNTDFDLTVDLDKPESAMMVRMMDCLIHAADTISGDPAQIVLAELEQTLITAFLTSACRDFRSHLERPAPALAPRQVIRVEGYIEQNWDQPVSIEALAAIAGASARSIYRSFKQSRGYTPQEFARQVRLRHARLMLLESSLTITEVALNCGFSDASHFSREYQRAFGQRPSDLRREAQRLSA